MPELTHKAIGNSATNQVEGGGTCGCVQVEDPMAEGSVVTGAGNGKASGSHSLVVEIEMLDKLPEHDGGANEKLFIKVKESDATRIVEKGTCSSWVVEIEKMFEDVNPKVERARWSARSIYRVPQFIKDMTNSEAYSPLFVSLGPLHHGETHLMPMEEHKRRAVAHMVKRSGKPIQEFMAAIDEVADELQAAYDVKWQGENKGRFLEMMVVDGCFLLEWAGLERRDYAANDPIFGVEGYHKLWPKIRRDMITMENQLPLIILQKLLAVYSGKFPEAILINRLVLHLLNEPRFGEGMDTLGLHFLDIFHKSYCRATPQWGGSNKHYEPCTPCAVELSEAGIQFRKNDTNSIHDIDLENGVLSMPLLKVHDSTEIYLLNLMAFEWLHPGSHFYVASYISFVDKIIVSERDVALLRSQGIIANMIGSDKKVAEMFNILTKLARTPMPGSKLGDVVCKVNSQCKKRWNPKKWRAIFMNTYLSNPWVIASTVAAFILLVAALLQTVYTIVPFYTRNG